MDALLTTFIAAALAEWGDKTQLLVMVLAIRYRRAGLLLLGVTLAALANAFIGAFGGTLINAMITPRAVSLLLALALVSAGVGGLIGSRRPDMGATWKVGPLLTAAGCFFLLECGDKTQFVTAALAAQFDSLVLAGLGAAAGVVVASIPPALLGARFTTAIPLKPIRIGIGALFLIVGLIVAISALRLV